MDRHVDTNSCGWVGVWTDMLILTVVGEWVSVWTDMLILTVVCGWVFGQTC